jgi:hypothetical protein
MENGVISIGTKKADVVPLGTNRLLDLTRGFIVREGGGITRELSEGQKRAYL